MVSCFFLDLSKMRTGSLKIQKSQMSKTEIVIFSTEKISAKADNISKFPRLSRQTGLSALRVGTQ